MHVFRRICDESDRLHYGRLCSVLLLLAALDVFYCYRVEICGLIDAIIVDGVAIV